MINSFKLLFWCFYLLFWPLFKGFLKLGQKYKNIFVGSLVQIKTLKVTFQINWPLPLQTANLGHFECAKVKQELTINCEICCIQQMRINGYWVARPPMAKRPRFLNPTYLIRKIYLTINWEICRIMEGFWI